jgi:hypothetical protein
VAVRSRVAAIRAHPIPERVYCEIDHAGRMLFVALFKKLKSLVFITETRIKSSQTDKDRRSASLTRIVVSFIMDGRFLKIRRGGAACLSFALSAR